jgi:hypothetical protein
MQVQPPGRPSGLSRAGRLPERGTGRGRVPSAPNPNEVGSWPTPTPTEGPPTRGETRPTPTGGPPTRGERKTPAQDMLDRSHRTLST